MNIATSGQLLKCAGILSFAVALFQSEITFSPSWSLYFGAPEELVSNPPLLYAAGLAAAVVFGVFGLYAMAGAGCMRSLPLLRWGLLAIGGVYTLRGVLLIPQLLAIQEIVQSTEAVTPQGIMSSLISLCVGLLYLAGTLGCWHSLQRGSKS